MHNCCSHALASSPSYRRVAQAANQGHICMHKHACLTPPGQPTCMTLDACKRCHTSPQLLCVPSLHLAVCDDLLLGLALNLASNLLQLVAPVLLSSTNKGLAVHTQQVQQPPTTHNATSAHCGRASKQPVQRPDSQHTITAPAATTCDAAFIGCLKMDSPNRQL